MDPQQVTPTTGEAVNKNLKPSPKPLLKNNSFSTIPIPKISFNLQVNAAVPTSLRTSNVNTPTPTTPPQVESPPPKLHTTARRVSSIKREGSGSLLNTGTSSKSHHHIGFGKRRTRNTLSHMLVDLRGVKKRVNKDLEQFLKTIPEDCSEYLGELYDIASNFIDTTESEIWLIFFLIFIFKFLGVIFLQISLPTQVKRGHSKFFLLKNQIQLNTSFD